MSQEALTRGSKDVRRAMKRTVIALIAVAAGAVAVRGLERTLNAVFDKPPADLRREFSKVDGMLGGHYLADGTDEVLNSETVETLGTAQYLVRRYRDQNLVDGAPGSLVNLNVNYYSTGSSTPHVPEICWKGAGMVEAPVSRKTFVVQGLPRMNGKGELSDLTMKMVSFFPPGGAKTNAEGEPIYCNVAYVFHVNGVYAARAEEVTSLFWKMSNRYAYHAKIEVTPLARTPRGDQTQILICTQKQAQEIVSAFIREALPEVEACLPDPAILTPEPAGAGGAK